MTVADIDEGVLRERARRLLISGKLPGGDPAVSWAGSGRGEPCCVCQILVRPDETYVYATEGGYGYRIKACSPTADAVERASAQSAHPSGTGPVVRLRTADALP